MLPALTLVCPGERVTALPLFLLDFFSWFLSYSEFMKNNKLAFNGGLTCLSMTMCVSCDGFYLCVSRASVGSPTVTVKLRMDAKQY